MNQAFVAVPLNITADAIVNWLDNVGARLVVDAQGLTPHIIYAALFIAGGYVAAILVKRVIRELAADLNLDALVRRTALGDRMFDEEQSVGEILGTIVTLYIYLVVALLVANELALGPFAAALNGVIGFLPTAAVALAIIALGFWIADAAEQRVSAATPDGQSHIGAVFGLALQVFVYLVAVVVGFGVFAGTSGGGGFALPIVQAFTLGFALAFGLAIGWAAKEYIGTGDDESDGDTIAG